MISWKKLIKPNSKIILVLLAAALSGCGREKPDENYIARVDDSYLTEEDLSGLMDTVTSNYYRNEVIRNWVNIELLFKEAEAKGITGEKSFKYTIEKSKKELAAALLMQKVIDEYKLSFKESDLEEYFLTHKEDFILDAESFLINNAEFKSEEMALAFRNEVLENGWDKSVENIKKAKDLIFYENAVLKQEYEIHPAFLSRILKELYPQEVSIVINNSDNNFAVIQLLATLPGGEAPEYSFVKNKVEERFTAERSREYVEKYLKDLYSKYELDYKK